MRDPKVIEEKGQAIAKKILETKGLLKDDYTLARHYLIARMRYNFNTTRFFLENIKEPEFFPSKVCMITMFALPFCVHCAFMLFRPLSFLKNITTNTLLIGSTLAFGISVHSTVHDYATQDSLLGRRVILIVKFLGP